MKSAATSAVIFLIFVFCTDRVNGNIALKAKFMGNVKVIGDNELVHALSLTHCLAQCNKDPDCDAITFYDESHKCRLFKRCTRLQIIENDTSPHYWFFAKRPPIASDGYMYEEDSKSCIRITSEKVLYNEADEICSKNQAYLAELNSPQLRLLASKLLRIAGEEEAWVSSPSIFEKHSNSRNKGSHRKKRRLITSKSESHNSHAKLCWTLKFNQLVKTAACKLEKKFSICQIPIY